MSGLGHHSFNTHEGCSFGRLFVGRSRTGHSIRLWRGCSPRLHRADYAYCSQFAFFSLNRRRKGTVCTVIAAFTCTPIGRCWERGTGSITILLQLPVIRLVAKMMPGLYPRRHRPLLKELGCLGRESGSILGSLPSPLPVRRQC